MLQVWAVRSSADALCHACRDVFGEDMPIYLCLWHVNKAWERAGHKHLADAVVRKAIITDLLKIQQFVHDGLPPTAEQLPQLITNLRQTVLDMITGFRRKHAAHRAFVDYFNSEWVPKIGEHAWQQCTTLCALTTPAGYDSCVWLL